MTGWAARRFWTTTSIVEAPGGYRVQLDARPVMTPAKAPLLLPTRALAEAVAAEWDAQEHTLDPATMPLTRAANAALDKVVPRRDAVVEEIAGYGACDLLCYRAEGPAALTERQAAAWDPLLGWAERSLGAPLRVTTGIMPVPQPDRSLAALHGHVARHDAFALTALHELVSLSGSLVIGLRALTPDGDIDALWSATRIDETWQAEQWGVDDEAAHTAERRRQAFESAAHFHRIGKNGLDPHRAQDGRAQNA